MSEEGLAILRDWLAIKVHPDLDTRNNVLCRDGAINVAGGRFF